jgi:hypothetical protein
MPPICHPIASYASRRPLFHGLCRLAIPTNDPQGLVRERTSEAPHHGMCLLDLSPEFKGIA